MSYSVPFDAAHWQQMSGTERGFGKKLPMARSLVQTGILIGKTRPEVEAMLGPSLELSNMMLSKALAPASGKVHQSNPWDDALGYQLACSGGYYLLVCSELGVRLDASGRVVEVKIFER